MLSWGTLLGSGFGAAVIWGIVVLAKTWFNQPVVKATVADKLNDSALELVRQARDDAKAASADAALARGDADAARREAVEARREATDARREAMDAMREFRRLKAAILSPYATLEVLREMVAEPGANGTAATFVPS